jgi:hypothetical protein
MDDYIPLVINAYTSREVIEYELFVLTAKAGRMTYVARDYARLHAEINRLLDELVGR